MFPMQIPSAVFCGRGVIFKKKALPDLSQIRQSFQLFYSASDDSFGESRKTILFTKKNTTMLTPPLRTVVPML